MAGGEDVFEDAKDASEDATPDTTPKDAHGSADPLSRDAGTPTLFGNASRHQKLTGNICGSDG